MGWFEFILERYNYWIVIILMMTGLYIVFARGNLVKKIVGLNLFQTSVFIFYITIGKIAGGTAPIYKHGELDHGGGEGAHGDGAEAAHGADTGADIGADTIGTHGESLHDAPVSELPTNQIGNTADKIGNGTSEALHSKIENDFSTGDLKAALKDRTPLENGADATSLHTEPAAGALDKISNDTLSGIGKPEAPGYELTPQLLHDGDHANTIGDAAGNAISHASDVIYTNPLPHVLILTAIVVGVATTAVGLALAVRIREAYGTIEEDELEAIDNVAEFGAAHEGAS